MKELCFCEGCHSEFWLDIDLNKKGSLCPNGCPRHQQILLGSTDEEIEIRRKKFIRTEKFVPYVRNEEHIQAFMGEDEEVLQEEYDEQDSEALLDNMERELLEELMGWDESNYYGK